MFGRTLQVDVVKTRKGEPTVVTSPSVSVEDLTHIAKKVVTYIAVGGVAIFAAVVTLNTASEIAVNRLSITEKEEEH